MAKSKPLAIVILLIVGVSAWFAWRGAAGSWRYYLSADECLAEARELTGVRVRVSGKVAAGTLRIADDRRQVCFSLQADGGGLPVVCSCPAPDNLRDGTEVVVEGRLEGPAPLLRGDKLLTRCASKYEPKAHPASIPKGPEQATP